MLLRGLQSRLSMRLLLTASVFASLQRMICASLRGQRWWQTAQQVGCTQHQMLVDLLEKMQKCVTHIAAKSLPQASPRRTQMLGACWSARTGTRSARRSSALRYWSRGVLESFQQPSCRMDAACCAGIIVKQHDPLARVGHGKCRGAGSRPGQGRRVWRHSLSEPGVWGLPRR